MIWSLLWSLSAVMNLILYKLALRSGEKRGISESAMLAWSYILTLALFAVLYLIVPEWFLFPSGASVLWIVGLIGMAGWAGAIAERLRQRAYLEEKLTVLAPYEQTSTFLVVVLSFIIFIETRSVVTLSCALVGVLVISSLAYYRLVLSRERVSSKRTIALFLLAEVIQTGATLLIAWLLTSIDISPALLYGIDVLFGTCVALILSMRTADDRSDLLRAPRIGRFMGLISMVNILWLTVALSTAFVTATHGLLLATLLQLMTYVLTIVFSKKILWESPRRLDIAVGGILTLLVAVGALWG